MPVTSFSFPDDKINADCCGLDIGGSAGKSQDLLDGELLKIRAGRNKKNQSDLPSVRRGSRFCRRNGVK